MAGESDNPIEAAARLEAALERIAQAAQARPMAVSARPDGVVAAAPPSQDMVVRLDALIDELRTALGAKPA